MVFSLCDDPLPSNGGDVEDEEMERELCILQGVLEHILPWAGAHVHTLDLSHGKAVSNELVTTFPYVSCFAISRVSPWIRCFVC